MMINGSCLCGLVKYEISGKVGDIVHCHCKTCRKAHGSAFSSVAAVQDCDFNLLAKDSLGSYESSAGKYRYFCSNCGSQIYAKRDGAAHVILRLGSLDSDIGSQAKEHIWVSEKANWNCTSSQLPEREKFE
ncbi:GFA family protein [Moritella viscosa]|uniref:GFA family protein n=1 Tax=Moritella viscosa TaxID=80854 RepID=UPI001C318F28|nr:GFA family protein [Moritella viscosa]